MKFAEHLGAHITPEWRKQYIQYEEMKTMLYMAMEDAPDAEVVEPEVMERYYAQFDEKFFTFCHKELDKINIFFSEKMAEATRKFSALESELESSEEPMQREKGIFGALRRGGRKELSTTGRDKVPPRKLQDLKLAFSEYYLSLVLLQNYQNLNFTGFRKILKKHDKNLTTDAGAKWRSEHVDTANFYKDKSIDKLIQKTETTFINRLEDGDRQKAMKRLRVPPLGDQQSPWTTFKLGLFSGAFIVLLISVVLSAIFHDYSAYIDDGSEQQEPHSAENSGLDQLEEKNMDTPDWQLIIKLYRGPLLLICFIFFMGINVYGWRSSGVNHVLIFELNPRNHLSEQHLMELAAILGVIWTLSVLSFLYSDYLSIPAFANPLALVGLMATFMLNPTKTFRHEARFWLLRVLGRIFCAPFFYVGFADFWVADQLNSLAATFTDFHFLICFYSHTDQTLDASWNVAGDASFCTSKHNWVVPVVSALPAWFRFAQCLRRYRDTKEAFPHLVNAGKYSTTFFVVLFSSLFNWFRDDVTGAYNALFYLYICASIVSSIYAYTWDIKMDWGLLDKNAGENRFLREEVVYSSKTYYYFAILEDLALRFAWAVSLFLTESLSVPKDLITNVTSPLEVFRRFVWNFFRLENEHLNNCGKFRAVRDISVAPIEASDQDEILKLMDEEDGIFNLRKKKKGVVSGFTGLGVATAALKKNKSAMKQRLLSQEESIQDPERA